jgi:hypothetical protein
VYALSEAREGGGLTDGQEAARARLSELLAALTDGGVTGAGSLSYAPTALAAVVTPWVDPGDGLPRPDQPWPGPALPGEPTGGTRWSVTFRPLLPDETGCADLTG